MRILTEQEKRFNNWVELHIKDSGHQWGQGFYIETLDGKVLFNGTPEYKEWYDSKLEEYNKISNK